MIKGVRRSVLLCAFTHGGRSENVVVRTFEYTHVYSGGEYLRSLCMVVRMIIRVKMCACPERVWHASVSLNLSLSHGG